MPSESRRAIKGLPLSGGFLCLLGCLFFLAPFYLFPVCELSGRARINPAQALPAVPFQRRMPCHYTARSEAGLGATLFFMGLSLFFTTSKSYRKGLAFSALALSVYAAALPLHLTGLCPGPMMPCRLGTLPAILILSGILSAWSLAVLLKRLPKTEQA